MNRMDEEALRWAYHVVESSPVVLFRWKLAEGWPIEMVSRNVIQFGYDPQELVSKAVPYASLILPEDLDRVAREVQEYSSSGVESFQQEYRIVTRDGRARWLDDRTVVERDADGRITSFQGIVIDITERKQAEESLNEKTHFIDSLLRAIPLPVFYKDREGRYLGCNEAFTEIMGVTAEQMRGRTVHELWPSDLADRYHAMDLALMRNREHQVYEFMVKAKDGQTHPVIYAKDVYLDKDGDVAGLIGAFIDITERKRTEDELIRQTTLFSNLFESSPEAIAVLDHEDRVLEVNRSFEALFGYTETEARGHRINDLVAPGPYLQDARDTSEAVIGNGRVVEKEAVRCTKEGRPVHVSLIGYPIVLNGRQIGAYAIYRDVTIQKRAQEELLESEARFRMAFHTSPDSININRLDDGLYVDINDGFTTLTGYTREDVIGKTSKEINIWHDAEDRKRLIQGLREKGYYKNLEAQFMRKDGSIGTGLMSARGITLEGVPHILSITRDITERKRAEEEKEKLEAQLVQAQKMESIGRLAGGVAHDFNNMLSAILGHGELALEKCQPSEPIRDDLEVIIKAAQRSAELTRQLLAFARRQTVAPRVLDLNDVVAGMLKMLQRLIGEDVDFAWMPGAGLWPVRVDPSQIDQILANLCLNARDAIDGVGRITIETENIVLDEHYCAVHPGYLCGEFVMLAVSDDGSGMDRDIIDNIFEPFFTTKERGKGTGLGLATVYGIVKQNDGFINVYSEPGRGSTFRIYLPRFLGEAVESAVESGGEMKRGKGETVLLVEDEEVILNLGQAMLERLGYKVIAAGTPGEAIRLAGIHAEEIRLLITDVVMPVMSGRELAKAISDIKPGIQCLYISGYTANVIVHRGVLDEGVHFLQKPFSMKDLASKVSEALK